jgi:hypothetical protein
MMRFAKRPRYPFTWSQRKAAAVLVSQRKARERLPLFADAIAAEQPDVDQVRDDRELRWIARELEQRSKEAAKWRKTRREIDALEPPARRLFLDYWNGHSKSPGNAGYLATVLHMFKTGRLVEHNGKLESPHWIAHDRRLEAKLRDMSDQELDSTIQSHVNMHFVELGRAEKRRRWEQQL